MPHTWHGVKPGSTPQPVVAVCMGHIGNKMAHYLALRRAAVARRILEYLNMQRRNMMYQSTYLITCEGPVLGREGTEGRGETPRNYSGSRGRRSMSSQMTDRPVPLPALGELFPVEIQASLDSHA
jgi:hypothetical protein